jgi:pimeloyl-ACP methyl ester carboxylesterase
VAGRGPALVLTHAAVADHRMWDEQFPAFAAHYRTIRYDFRGYGKSSDAAGPFSFEQDIHDLLAHLGERRAALCGLSRGGFISVCTTLAYPDMVAALIVAGSGVGHNPPSDLLMAWGDRVDEAEGRRDWEAANEIELQLWVDGPERGPGVVDPRVRELVSGWNLAAFRRPAGPGQPVPLAPPPKERLHEVHVPTLVVVGDADVPDVVVSAALLARDIAGARQVVFPNVAHMINMERPAEFTPLVLDFLRAVYPPHPQ